MASRKLSALQWASLEACSSVRRLDISERDCSRCHIAAELVGFSFAGFYTELCTRIDFAAMWASEVRTTPTKVRGDGPEKDFYLRLLDVWPRKLPCGLAGLFCKALKIGVHDT